MIAHWLTLPPWGLAIVAVHLLVMLLLALLGIHRLTQTRAAARAGSVHLPTRAWPDAEPLPIVTVQLPLYNERFVAERLLAAAGSLDWPKDRLEIQVIDDSSDDTTDIVARAVARLRAIGIDAHHLRRGTRAGFKAGALGHGLAVARGELIAIFDADFVPAPGTIRAAIPHFADASVGLVQLRWGFLNRGTSLLTRIQALLLDGHFLVEHHARASRGFFFNFNGTAGIWRKAAIVDSGGWQADTLTEDLDLSYRAQLRGWRFVYLRDVVADSELPAGIHAFRGQQYRWAKGSAQTAKKLLATVIAAPLPLRTRIEAAIHLSANFGYVLLLALALLTVPALALRYRAGPEQALAIDLPFLLFASATVAAFYALPLRPAQASWRRWLLLPALMALGIGMSLHNTRAVLSGLFGSRGDFERTPKDGHDPPDPRRRYPAPSRSRGLTEIAIGLGFVAAATAASTTGGLLLSVPFFLLYASGFLGIGILLQRSGE